MRSFSKAISKGNEEEVSRLLDADPTLLERENRIGDTPLVQAVQAGWLGMVKLLVQRGANINATGKWGESPLLSAVERDREDMATFLLNNGAWAGRDKDGVTPLGLAFCFGFLGVMSTLLRHMGEQGLQETTEMGWTALMAASSSGQMGAVQVLVEEMEGQGLDEQDQKGRTALHWAAKGGDEEVVTLLLSKGAQADIGDDNGITPFMEAAGNGHLGVVQPLLQHMGGQGLDRTDEFGTTALQLAAEEGHEAVVTFLLSRGAQAINGGLYCMTPLTSACEGGHVGVVQRMVEHMEAQGLDERDDRGKTALHCAVRGGYAEAAAILLRSGAGASVRDDEGRTPLMEVGKEGQLGAMQILLQEVGEQGLQERDMHGYTALHHAAMNDHEEVVQALLLVGADPTIKDNEGRTPRALAEGKGHDECADVFEVSMPQSHFIISHNAG
jgi:ankyrin repeat protein